MMDKAVFQVRTGRILRALEEIRSTARFPGMDEVLERGGILGAAKRVSEAVSLDRDPDAEDEQALVLLEASVPRIIEAAAISKETGLDFGTAFRAAVSQEISRTEAHEEFSPLMGFLAPVLISVASAVVSTLLVRTLFGSGRSKSAPESNTIDAEFEVVR